MYNRNKVSFASKWCNLSRTPNIYVNIIKKTMQMINIGTEFHLLHIQNTIVTCFQTADRCTSQCLIWLQANLSGPTMSWSGRIVFQLFWRRQSSNCTTHQVVHIIAFNALQNNQRAARHLENDFSKRPSTFKAPTNIILFVILGIYLTSFNSLNVSSYILIRTEPLPTNWHVWSSLMDIKLPSSSSKLANNFLLGQMW